MEQRGQLASAFFERQWDARWVWLLLHSVKQSSIRVWSSRSRMSATLSTGPAPLWLLIALAENFIVGIMTPSIVHHSGPSFVRSSALLNCFGFQSQLKPFLERRDAAKCFGIYFTRNSHPINGYAIGHTVDAHALVLLRSSGRAVFPEPQDRSSLGSFHRDEATFSGGGLKLLKSLH
jgi:hypothetical protein